MKIEQNSQFSLINMFIETITPLHIGNNEVISSVGEYFSTGNKIRYLDTERIANDLNELNKIDEYSNDIIATPQGFDTFKTLSEYGFNLEEYVYKEFDLAQNSLNTLQNNILHTFIETNGKKYIPGSSIKGILKTIILYSYLENDKNILSNIENEIMNCKDKELFKKLNEISNTKLSKVISDKESKCLRIIDSSSVDNENIQVEQIRRDHLTDKKSDGLDWLEETIKAETIVPFQIKLFSKDNGDKSHIEEFFQNDFFASVNNYSLIMIGVEINLLKLSKFERKNTLIDQLILLENEIKQSKNKYAICRLGKGKTVYFNVIWPLLKEGIQRKIIHNLFKTDENEQLFPITRVLTHNDEMLGWIRLKCDVKEGNIPKITEIIPASNHVNEIEPKLTQIEVTVLTSKNVTFYINDEKYENVQLINPFKIDFSPGEKIQVTIWQLNKSGKINQVKCE